MESIGSNVDNAEQFIAEYVKVTFAFLNLGDPIILPKQGVEKKEFVGILLTSSDPDELDSTNLKYDIVIRLGNYRETKFDDRNKIIDINRKFNKDIQNYLKSNPQSDIFELVKDGEVNFQIDDDFYDSVFGISALI